MAWENKYPGKTVYTAGKIGTIGPKSKLKKVLNKQYLFFYLTYQIKFELNFKQFKWIEKYIVQLKICMMKLRYTLLNFLCKVSESIFHPLFEKHVYTFSFVSVSNGNFNRFLSMIVPWRDSKSLRKLNCMCVTYIFVWVLESVINLLIVFHKNQHYH